MKNIDSITTMKYFSFGTLTVSFVFVFILIFWATFPYKTVDLKAIEVKTPKVSPGQTLMYELDYCRYTDTQAIVSRRFVDGIIYSMPDIMGSNPKGCAKRTIGVQVPEGLVPGEYYLQVTNTYHVNPIRTISKTIKTAEFEIIK